MHGGSGLTKTERIIKVLSVFFITMLLTSAIFFAIVFNDPFAMVIWFGFLVIPLYVYHIIAFSISVVLALIIARIVYIQWRRGSPSFTKYQVLLYLLVIGLGILFVFSTHSHLLGYGIFFLDVLIIAQVGLMSILIGVTIWQSRERKVIGERAWLREQKRQLRDLSNQVQSELYEMDRLSSSRPKRFFIKYMAHHFWVGVLLFAMGLGIHIFNPTWNFGTALLLGIVGVILIVDDTVNHIVHKSITNLFPKRVKNERAYDQVGKVFTVFIIVGFLIIVLFGVYAWVVLEIRF